MKESNSTEELYADEIELSSIIAVLWKRRKLIFFGTLGATLLSILISLFIPRVYLSEGFYQLGNVKTTITKNMDSPSVAFKENNVKKTITMKTASIGMPIPLYKSISPQFSDLNHFQLIASQDNLLNEENLKEIKADFRTAADINKWIKPVYAYAKEDAREFAQLSKDDFNSVIGANLKYEADSPDNANTFVRFFGNYIRDCVLYSYLYNYITDEYNNSISEINKNENDITGVKFQLLQNTNKMKDIQAILTNYPESSKIDNRQLVSVQEGGSRFLSPITQLVGIESTLADLRRVLAELERDKEKFAITAKYFSLCNSELMKIDKRGESLFLLLKTIKAQIFKNEDFSRDTIKEVYNHLSIDLQAFELAFFNNCRFTSGPTIPEKYIKPRKSLIVIASCFFSFFLLVILAIILHWLQNNKKTLTSSNSKPL